MKKILASAFFTALFAAPGFAADLTGEEAPVAPYEEPAAAAGGWAGAYGGVTGGYAFGRVDASGAGRVPARGLKGGAFGGVQGQNGQIVYGAEADGGYDGGKGAVGAYEALGGVNGSLRGRLGYAVTDDVLAYGTAGVAAKNLRVRDASGTAGGLVTGYTVGGGIDAKLTSKIFARGEYRYTDYGARSLNTGSGAQTVDAKGSAVNLGIGFKF